MATGWTCSLCTTENAESLCCCSNAETLLCRNCLVAHYTKFPKRLHQNLPLAAYGHHKAPGYFDRLNARTQAIEAGKEALMKQLQSIDHCLEEIATKINELYQRIWEAGQKASEEVKQTQIVLRETVQRSIEEAERTIYEDEPVLSEMYTKALRTFTGDFLVNLFQYEVKVCENVDSIFNVTFKTAAGLEPLPEVKKLVPSSAAVKPVPSAMVWECKECGYEKNQQHLTACVKCNKQNFAVPDSPIPSQQVHVSQVPVPINPYSQVSVSMAPPQIPEEREAAQPSNWSCSLCQFSNLPGNPICYQCRTSRDGTFAPVYESESLTDFPLMTMREGSLPWTCKCGREHPFTVKRCECGYLNLALISEKDAEPELPLPFVASESIATSVPAVSLPPAMLWKCRECGYEWNLEHLTACAKCNKQNLAVLAPPILSQQVRAPQVSAPMGPSLQVPASVIPPSMALSPHLSVPIVSQVPEERKIAQPRIGENPMIWTCSCEYSYNLVTAENCTRCSLPNPFLPAKPPPKKCVKCGTRDITQPDNTCWSCHTDKRILLKPLANTYWTCVPCNYDSNLINGKCWKCKRTQEEVYPELKKNPTSDSPQKALWQCTKCGISNEPARMKCTGCDQSKGIIRCTTCGSPKECELATCTQCGA